jgi:hypothetical protein
MGAPKDLITTTEARQLLGVGKHKMKDLLGTELAVYTNPLDKRKKLVSRAEVLKLKEPRAEAA